MRLILRFAIYLLGLAILSLGVVLNTKTGYGVAALSSMAYVISVLSEITLGSITILVYCIYVILEIIIMRHRFTPKILLQIPCSILFGKYTNFFNDAITITPPNHFVRVVLLILAIFFTSLGVVLTLNMNLVPNAPDGLVQEIGVAMKKDFGFAKNLFDGISVGVSVILGLFIGGQIIGIGIGTLVSAVMIGRTITLLNKYLRNRLMVIGNTPVSTGKAT